MGRQLGYATVAVLRAIRQGYRYGFEVMEYTGFPSGTVYPALSTLEERGYLRARWEHRDVATAEGRPRRRYYTVTASGERALHAAIRRMSALAEAEDTTRETPGRALGLAEGAGS